ncbi:stress response translation initiation inhibitor YciH [Halorussus sp. MSC15.2]|uniref:stress response translation initiation inhibitor YciH n=1 Tax=Halorussus sp. MSC15.2 TaxID=2283638 RepID=UPI0013D19049|nr:stress response translation initiation inhibitor YciH [Halorussus sp. MSC15.2]NEU57007.1 stress response translation initiation inhibitor YciH [Halorussus sp. MSC15.2]
MGEDKDISDVSGLPDELGIDEDLGRAEQRLAVRVEERTYGKAMTIVEGFDDSSVDVGDLASTLKSRLATGGTVDEGRIELQGDHRERVGEILRDEGFNVGE